MFSFKRVLGLEDATPRAMNRQVPGHISSISKDYGGSAQLSRFPSNSRSSGHDRSAGGSRRVPASMEERCVCEECEISAHVQKMVKKFRAAQDDPRTKPELTQDDRDQILFCSTAFRKYFEQQDEGVIDYANWLCKNLNGWKTQALNHRREIGELQLKLATAESVSDGLQKELEKSKAYIQQIQKEAMSTVDRFQPTTDGEVTDKVKRLGAKIESLVNTMVKCPSTLCDEQWESAAAELIYPDSMAENCDPVEVDVRTLKKSTLRNIIWYFLTSRVFDKPFGGFQDDEATSADDMYNILFPREDLGLDSESWRSLTAASLQKRPQTLAKTETLLSVFQQVIVQVLGYNEKDEALVQKIAAVIVLALEFWKLTAQQRAIFSFRWFDCATAPLIRNAKDHRYTTIEVGDDDEEQSGQIWFVTRPGLAKCGSGSGKGYDKTVMFEDFKAHVMVVDDTRYLPQESTKVEHTPSAEPNGKRIVLNGGPEDQPDLNVMDLDVEPVKHVDQSPVSAKPVESVGDVTEPSVNEEAPKNPANASFRARMGIDDKSSKDAEVPPSDEQPEIDNGKQTFVDADGIVDKMVEVISQMPNTANTSLASADVIQTPSDGRHSSMSARSEKRWHPSDVARSNHHAVILSSANVRDVKIASIGAQ